MPTLWLTALLVCGATFRVTRFLTRDQLPLVARPREVLIGFWYPDFAEPEWRARYESRHGVPARPHWGGFGHSLAYLITCDWCTSIYVAAGLVAGLAVWTNWLPDPTWVAAALLGLTASGVTALVANHLDAD